ncbi:MAG: S-adenosylmethionine decarboxylase [Nitrospiraceae bacterium]|nr:S-adenosylmethionine decarboxylase [Nitrospiraceae bacterium]
MNNGSAHALKGEVVDLAPDIYRQRLVIEGIPAAPINDVQIVAYLRDLGTVCDMKVLTDPVTHLSETYGWAGWVHWETSGAHFYAWETPRLFFSVDIYTCKPFDAAVAAEFTRKALGASVITFREF